MESREGFFTSSCKPDKVRKHHRIQPTYVNNTSTTGICKSTKHIFPPSCARMTILTYMTLGKVLLLEVLVQVDT